MKDPMQIATQELLNAGWERAFSNVWRSPSGALFLGPNQAHRTMKQYPRLNLRKPKQEVSIRPEVDEPLA